MFKQQEFIFTPRVLVWGNRARGKFAAKNIKYIGSISDINEHKNREF